MLAEQLEIELAEFLILFQRKLEGRALQMVQQDLEVVRIHIAVLGRMVEEVVGVLNDKLVERRAGSHQQRGGTAFAAARPARPLPGGSNGARITRHHRHVEAADIDAQLEGVGGNHAQQSPFAQVALNFPPFERQIPAPVSANHFRAHRPPGKIFFQVSHQNFRGQARVGKDNGFQAPHHKDLRQPAGLVQIRPANTELPVHHRRIVKHKKLFGGGRPVLIHQHDVLLDDARGQLSRIGDGCRGADKLRMATVKFRDALEPPDDVGQVAAENAAVVVQLVDDNVAKILKQPLPLGVVRQDARVQHVRVGDHQVGAGPDGFARVLRSVAVVGKGSKIVAQLFRPAVELHQLVLRQGLGGKKVERPRIRIFNQLAQDRQVVTKRFAGGRGSHHHDVLSLVRQGGGNGLVRVEVFNALRPEGLLDALGKKLRKRHDLCLPRRIMPHGGDASFAAGTLKAVLDFLDDGLDGSGAAKPALQFLGLGNQMGL